jgi:hypothetical protein
MLLNSILFSVRIACKVPVLFSELSPELIIVTKYHRSRRSLGSIVSDYGLDDRAIGVRSPVGTKDFSSNLCAQTGSGAHPASCTVGTRGPFPGAKAWPGRDADHSPPSSAEVVNEKEPYILSPQAPPRRVAGLLCFFNEISYLLVYCFDDCYRLASILLEGLEQLPGFKRYQLIHHVQ